MSRCKMTKLISNCISPCDRVGQGYQDTCDDFEVYKDCGYVVVSTTARNHAKRAIFSFNGGKSAVKGTQTL